MDHCAYEDRNKFVQFIDNSIKPVDVLSDNLILQTNVTSSAGYWKRKVL